jgi:hypothetical protein
MTVIETLERENGELHTALFAMRRRAVHLEALLLHAMGLLSTTELGLPAVAIGVAQTSTLSLEITDQGTRATRVAGKLGS